MIILKHVALFMLVFFGLKTLLSMIVSMKDIKVSTTGENTILIYVTIIALSVTILFIGVIK